MVLWNPLYPCMKVGKYFNYYYLHYSFTGIFCSHLHELYVDIQMNDIYVTTLMLCVYKESVMDV